MPEQELARILDSLTSQLEEPHRAIFNLHCPPYDSTIDAAPQLDKTLKPLTAGEQPMMVPVESKANRAAIEDLTLCWVCTGISTSQGEHTESDRRSV